MGLDATTINQNQIIFQNGWEFDYFWLQISSTSPSGRILRSQDFCWLFVPVKEETIRRNETLRLLEMEPKGKEKGLEELISELKQSLLRQKALKAMDLEEYLDTFDKNNDQ